MKTDTGKHKNVRTALLRHWKKLVSICVVAVAVFAIGIGIFSTQPSSASLKADEWPVAESAPSTEAESPDSEAQGSPNDPIEIGSDPQYGDFEVGKLLVLVDESTDLNHVNAILRDAEFAKTKDVTDQDISIGFVEVEIDDTMPMSEALDALDNKGLRAQPNYVYYLAESERLDVIEDQTTSDVSSNIVAQESTTSYSSAASTVAGVTINDPDAAQEWYLESLDLYRAWGISKSESNRTPPVSIAIIDSGCLVTHEDLKGNIVATYNSVSQAEGADQVEDEGGHGTHVAGIAAARANNGIGAAGTSYNAGLVIVKANDGLDKSGQPAFSTVTLASAYSWFLSDSGNGQTVAERYNLRVVNMSLGGPSTVDTNDALYTLITRAKEAGILTVCAAGNAVSGGVPPYNVIPGDYGDCLTVINLFESSGSAPNDSSGTYYVERSLSSNYNVASGEYARAKNISAPGTGIYSTLYTGTSSYGSKSGTSMASPAVAGVAALLFAYDPELTPAEAQTLLEQTATDISTPSWDRETGYGEVDAYHALQVLSASITLESISYKDSAELAVTCPDGSSLPASEWTWASSDQSILAISEAEGTVQAHATGTVKLTATHPAGQEIAKEVMVKPADLSRAQITLDKNHTYSGKAIEPSIHVTLNGQNLTAGADYTISFSNNVNAGREATVTITGTGAGNYAGSAQAKFTINPASISAATLITVNETPTYTGEALKPRVTVRDGSKTLRENTDYTVSYDMNVNAGTDTGVVKVTGIGNYNGSTRANFTINQRSLNNAMASVTPQTYTGTALTPSPTVTVSSIGELKRGVDYEVVAYDNNVNVGTSASLTIVGKGNFTGSRKVGFEIKAASQTPSSPAQPTKGVSMYRLYNPNSGEHLFTIDANEYATLPRYGWRQEGIAWTSPSEGTPVYRLYNPYSGDHHYTMDANEYASLPRYGWRQEGIVFRSDPAKGRAIYRLFNPYATAGTHHYTLDANEYASLPHHGWRQEGVAWYGIK